jgi:hypothetical protein
MRWNQTAARRTSIVEFRHVDGTLHGGAVGGSQRETFAVVSYPRYGDTDSRRFRYDEVAEVLSSTPRVTVPLATFSRLMGG